MQQAAEFYDKKKDNLWIQTYKGRRFYLDDPKFDIQEIAHSLSLQCRFTGHVKEFYSVAEHSILVAGLTKEFGGNPFEGLMHDAHEAYFSDLASPWKTVVPDYKKRELALEAACRKHFGLEPQISEEAKRADWVALFIEARNLLNGSIEDWTAPPGIVELANKYKNLRPSCLYPREASRAFKEAYDDLCFTGIRT